MCEINTDKSSKSEARARMLGGGEQGLKELTLVSECFNPHLLWTNRWQSLAVSARCCAWSLLEDSGFVSRWWQQSTCVAAWLTGLFYIASWAGLTVTPPLLSSELQNVQSKQRLLKGAGADSWFPTIQRTIIPLQTLQHCVIINLSAVVWPRLPPLWGLYFSKYATFTFIPCLLCAYLKWSALLWRFNTFLTPLQMFSVIKWYKKTAAGWWRAIYFCVIILRRVCLQCDHVVKLKWIIKNTPVIILTLFLSFAWTNIRGHFILC